MEEQKKIFAGFGNKTGKDEYLLMLCENGHFFK